LREQVSTAILEKKASKERRGEEIIKIRQSGRGGVQ
jgi:hypothetical protein